ncbi:hypothetical protein MBLNU457_4322t1 [Dothideomycetes sp. NU457]
MADTTSSGQGSSYQGLNSNAAPTFSNTSNNDSAQAQASNLKDTVVNSEVHAQNAMNAVANHPVTQNITQGPMAEKARDQMDKTSNEFSNVANSRKVPDQPAATGQPLTQYHSLFYNILSWENPRVTAISYVSIVALIFVTRYVPILKLTLKGAYIVLGVIAAAESAGKFIFDRGVASQMRPRKYYTIPRETLEASLEDAEQFVNFFIIELQRIVFAENIYATIGAFTSALLAYFLIKFTPTWGVALVFTTVIYFAPLIYLQNKEFIDHHLNNASNVINEQTSQFRDLAAQQASHATEVTKSTVGQLSAKAQELMGQAQDRAAQPDVPNPGNLNPAKDEPERNASNNVSSSDFPSAPKTSFEHGGLSSTEPHAEHSGESRVPAQ